MKIYKIYYKIISSNKSIHKHVFILKEENDTQAEIRFREFIESNLDSGDKIFGPISITQIPDDINMIYSSYIPFGL